MLYFYFPILGEETKVSLYFARMFVIKSKKGKIMLGNKIKHYINFPSPKTQTETSIQKASLTLKKY